MQFFSGVWLLFLLFAVGFDGWSMTRKITQPNITSFEAKCLLFFSVKSEKKLIGSKAVHIFFGVFVFTFPSNVTIVHEHLDCPI